MISIKLIFYKSISNKKNEELETIKHNFQENIQSLYDKKIDFDLDIYIYLIPNFVNNNIHYDHEDEIKKIAYYTFDLNISNNNELKYRNFRAFLDKYLQNLDLKHLIDDEFKWLSIIVSFGKELKILQNQNEEKILADVEESNIIYVPIEPYYTFDQVILNTEVLDDIKKTLILLQQRHILYEKWGFKKIEPLPKAILNFYGPPGTGKTITAHAIAKHLNMKILPLNYADIESKFVGEAPKNLVKAFNIAKRENALLFFDEADSFLGRRITSVSSSADQAVNSLRSQLLILLENYTGVVIFATNLLKNYDRAFESRILKHIKFDLPDKSLRVKMITNMIPSEVPLNNPIDEKQLDDLADITEGFSGREIKNCIRDALSSVLFQNKDMVTIDDFKDSFVNYTEKKKNLEKEYHTNGIYASSKSQLEKKIKDNLKEDDTFNKEIEKNKTILNIGLHALWADNNAKPEEFEIIKSNAQLLNINSNFDITLDPTHLPDLEKLILNLETKNDRFYALKLAINVITADGDVCEQEEKFINNILNLLKIDAKINELVDKIKNSNLTIIGEWKKIYQILP